MIHPDAPLPSMVIMRAGRVLIGNLPKSLSAKLLATRHALDVRLETERRPGGPPKNWGKDRR